MDCSALVTDFLPATGGQRRVLQGERDHHKGHKNVDLLMIISEPDSPSLSLAGLTVNWELAVSVSFYGD